MAFRYRFYPDASQLHGCERHCADARYVWNLALEQANWWRPGRRPTPVGIDLGIAHTATISTGDHFDIPGLRPGEQARLLRLERKKARQCEGSNRHARTKRAIAVLHARATDRRKDWVEKISTQLVTAHNLIVFEDLRVKNMLRSARGTVQSPGHNVAAKAGLNRRIAASAWSLLARRTTEKAAASQGCEVLRVDPRYTSQQCSACGHVHPGNRSSQAIFSCLNCGYAENADVNAARNILAAGLAVTARGRRPEVGAPGEARTNQQEAA